MEKVVEEPGHQEEIDKAKVELQGKPMGDLASSYRQWYDEKEKLNQLISNLNTKLDAAGQLLLENLERQGLEQLRTTDGSTTLFIKDDVYCKQENRHEYLTWIKQNGMEDLLTVHYSTMNAQTTDRLVKGHTMQNDFSTLGLRRRHLGQRSYFRQHDHRVDAVEPRRQGHALI